MADDVGLDVSDRDTAIHVVDEGGRLVWRGKRASEPEAVAAALRRHAAHLDRVGLETGQLAPWLYHSLKQLGFPVVCLDARHVRAATALQRNKTDAHDAECQAPEFRRQRVDLVRIGGIAAISPTRSSRPRSRSAIGSCVPVARRAAGRRRFRHPPMLTSWSVCAARCGSSGRSAFFAAAGFLHLAVVLDAWSRKIPRVRLRPPEGRLWLVDGPPSTHRAGAGRARRGGD